MSVIHLLKSLMGDGMKQLYKYIRVIVWIVPVSLFSLLAYAGESGYFFAKAKEAARTGQLDAAFMNYRFLLINDPDFKLRHLALFANGEYNFLMSSYAEATSLFKDYLETKTDDQSKLFALAYLYKMAEIKKEKDLFQKWQKQIVALKQHLFLFQEAKEYLYQSPLLRAHRAVFSIDKIEFFIEGDLFAQIIL